MPYIWGNGKMISMMKRGRIFILMGRGMRGEIMEGRKDGVGKMFYINGDVYEGEWI